jgi:hypothetical protein
MLVWLGVVTVLQLRPIARVDAPALSTPNVCKRGDEVARSRGIRVGDLEVMSLRSCQRGRRGDQDMSLALHSDYHWWIYGSEPVAAGVDPEGVRPELRLVRHALARGTLIDGAPAVIQVLDVLWIDRCLECDPPVNNRTMQQTVTICALPAWSVAACGTIAIACPKGRCGTPRLERGVLRSGAERITVETD